MSQIGLQQQDGGNFPNASGAPPWGIFLNGSPAITAESVNTYQFKKEWTLPDYPIEQGGFESYNKVEHPFDAVVRFVQGGSDSDRSAFLAEVLSVASDKQNLYSVVTPEYTWPIASVHMIGYERRNDTGLGLLIIDVGVTEIRVTGVTQFTQTKDAAGAAQQGGGNVQGQQMNAGQQQQVQNNQFFWGMDQLDNFNGGAGW